MFVNINIMFLDTQIFFVFTTTYYLYLQPLKFPAVDTTMTNCSYKKQFKAVFDMLNMVSLKTKSFGRYVAAIVLDMEEVDPMISKYYWELDYRHILRSV